jgi:hypothetical protein
MISPAFAAATHTATGDAQPPVVATRRPTERYGHGATDVDALRDVSADIGRSLTAAVGPCGSGKTTRICSRARTADYRGRLDRRDDQHPTRRHHAHQAPLAHRLHLPALQPATDAHRGREHRPTAGRSRRPPLPDGRPAGDGPPHEPEVPVLVPARHDRPADGRHHRPHVLRWTASASAFGAADIRQLTPPSRITAARLPGTSAGKDRGDALVAR